MESVYRGVARSGCGYKELGKYRIAFEEACKYRMCGIQRTEVSDCGIQRKLGKYRLRVYRGACSIGMWGSEGCKYRKIRRFGNLSEIGIEQNSIKDCILVKFDLLNIGNIISICVW